MACTHDGFHSGQGRYAPATGTLRYVMVCDDCQAELAELHAESYRPQYVPSGAGQASSGGTNG